MILRLLIYLATLVAGAVLAVVHQGWLSWILLLFTLMLPVFSILFSLPAMLSLRLGVDCATLLTAGDKEYPCFSPKSILPPPPVRGYLRITDVRTGKSRRLKPGMPLPTQYCGQLICTPERSVCFDYLGLLRLPVFRKESRTVTVRPQPLPMPLPSDLQSRIVRFWHPKPGGGFSENHELRLYRPGDSLNQIHWKLTAKTGKLVIREAMAARQSTACLVLSLCGTDEEVDRKLGRLLWVGQQLLKQNIRFEIHALTGHSMLCLPVEDERALLPAIDTLLGQPAAKDDAALSQISGAWKLYIGGDADEA